MNLLNNLIENDDEQGLLSVICRNGGKTIKEETEYKINDIQAQYDGDR